MKRHQIEMLVLHILIGEIIHRIYNDNNKIKIILTVIGFISLGMSILKIRKMLSYSIAIASSITKHQQIKIILELELAEIIRKSNYYHFRRTN